MFKTIIFIILITCLIFFYSLNKNKRILTLISTQVHLNVNEDQIRIEKVSLNENFFINLKIYTLYSMRICLWGRTYK